MGATKTEWTECPRVERVMDRPVIRGTRMPADDVVENYESSSPVEETAENFGLNAK